MTVRLADLVASACRGPEPAGRLRLAIWPLREPVHHDQWYSARDDKERAYYARRDTRAFGWTVQIEGVDGAVGEIGGVEGDGLFGMDVGFSLAVQRLARAKGLLGVPPGLQEIVRAFGHRLGRIGPDGRGIGQRHKPRDAVTAKAEVAFDRAVARAAAAYARTDPRYDAAVAQADDAYRKVVAQQVREVHIESVWGGLGRKPGPVPKGAWSDWIPCFRERFA